MKSFWRVVSWEEMVFILVIAFVTFSFFIGPLIVNSRPLASHGLAAGQSDESVTRSVNAERLGLAAWWNFTEQEGDIAFDSINHYDLGLYGGPQWTRSEFGTSLLFDGDGAFLATPNDSILNLAEGSWTIALWVKMDQFKEGKNDIMMVGNYQALVYNFSGKFWRARFYTGEDYGWFMVQAAKESRVGHWVHLAVVWNENEKEFKIFVNGDLANKATSITHPLGARKGGISIGRKTGNGQYLKGQIADIRIYREALSGEAISQLASRSK